MTTTMIRTAVDCVMKKTPTAGSPTISARTSENPREISTNKTFCPSKRQKLAVPALQVEPKRRSSPLSRAATLSARAPCEITANTIPTTTSNTTSVIAAARKRNKLVWTQAAIFFNGAGKPPDGNLPDPPPEKLKAYEPPAPAKKPKNHRNLFCQVRRAALDITSP